MSSLLQLLKHSPRLSLVGMLFQELIQQLACLVAFAL